MEWKDSLIAGRYLVIEPYPEPLPYQDLTCLTAVDTYRDNRLVRVIVITQDEGSESVLDTARNAALFSAEGAVPIVDVGNTNDYDYVCTLVPAGVSLASITAVLSAQEVHFIGEKVARILSEARHQGFAHLQLRPNYIYVDPSSLTVSVDGIGLFSSFAHLTFDESERGEVDELEANGFVCTLAEIATGLRISDVGTHEVFAAVAGMDETPGVQELCATFASGEKISSMSEALLTLTPPPALESLPSFSDCTPYTPDISHVAEILLPHTPPAMSGETAQIDSLLGIETPDSHPMRPSWGFSRIQDSDTLNTDEQNMDTTHTDESNVDESITSNADESNTDEQNSLEHAEIDSSQDDSLQSAHSDEPNSASQTEEKVATKDLPLSSTPVTDIPTSEDISQVENVEENTTSRKEDDASKKKFLRSLRPSTWLILGAAGLLVVGAGASFATLLSPLRDVTAELPAFTPPAVTQPEEETPQPEEETPTPSTDTKPEIASVTLINPDASKLDPSTASTQDSPETVAQAADGNPATAWYSWWYSSPDFLSKSGVGLQVKLASKAYISQVHLAVDGQGGHVVWRNTSAEAPLEGDILAESALSADTILAPSSPVATDSLILWFDQLPTANNGRYQIILKEITFE